MEAKMSISNLLKHKGIVMGLGIAAVFVLCLSFSTSVTQGQDTAVPVPYLAANQLDDLVAPIALYPDPLISQILVASTYPLEIVEASQWLARNPTLTGAALTSAAGQQDWDPSIQALVPFPDVLKYLTEDIAWTTSLGNAFLAQESDVMDAIQRMRARAVQSGKLMPSPQEQIIRTYDSGQTIYSIVPVDPYVVYVPVYDPVWIWGPSIYYPYPRWYYSPHTPVLYYNRGISLNLYFGTTWQGWNNYGWRPAWTGHSVIVNNNFIHVHNLNTRYYSAPVGTVRWSHDESHRQGVPYPNREVANRYRGRNGVANSYSAAPSRPAIASSPSPSRNVSLPAQDRIAGPRQNPQVPTYTPAPAQSRSPVPARSFQQSQSPQQKNVVPNANPVPQLNTTQQGQQGQQGQLGRGNSQWNREREQARQPSVVAPSVVTPSRNAGPAPTQYRNNPPARQDNPSRMVPAVREVAPSQYRDAGTTRTVPASREVSRPPQTVAPNVASNSGTQNSVAQNNGRRESPSSISSSSSSGGEGHSNRAESRSGRR
jgi:hypothetical protein